MIRLRFAAAAFLAFAFALAPLPSWAVSEGDLKQAERELQRYFEGSMVTVLLDMPATAQGIDKVVVVGASKGSLSVPRRHNPTRSSS